MEIDLELTEKSAKNNQRWWKLTATIDYSTEYLYSSLKNLRHSRSRPTCVSMGLTFGVVRLLQGRGNIHAAAVTGTHRIAA